MRTHGKMLYRERLTKLLPYTLELSKVSLVLAFVFNLCLDTLKDSDGRRVVIDAASGTKSSLDNRGA